MTTDRYHPWRVRVTLTNGAAYLPALNETHAHQIAADWRTHGGQINSMHYPAHSVQRVLVEREPGR